MSSIVPSYSHARSDVDEIKTKLNDLSKDLDKFAPEHRNQVMVDRLRQQKLRAMISLAKAQHYLAETDVLIADYNLQAVAEEFEYMKKERFNNNTGVDAFDPQNSGKNEEKFVSTIDCPASGYPKDVFCDTSLLPAEGHTKNKEKGTELTPKLSTQLAEAHRSKSDAYTPTPKSIQALNEVDGSESTSKDTKASSKTYEPTKSKTYRDSSSKTREAAKSKSYEASSSKTKEATTSKISEATKSTKEADFPAETDLPAPGLKSKKRKRSKSKSKESKRHKSSHKHATSSHAAAESKHAPAPSSNVHKASLGTVASSQSPAASSNEKTALLESAESSLVHTAFSRAPAAPSYTLAAPSLMPAASSHIHALLSHAPNCDCLKSKRTYTEKTLLNTSISPIKKIVEAKGVQTDEKASKNDIVQTDEVKIHIETVTKAIQTDNVIILHVGSQTIREKTPDIEDEETLLLDTLPAPHSHSTAISLAKALQQIKSQKTSVLERMCQTGSDVSQALSSNDVGKKMELVIEHEAETARECPGVVKMEIPDDLPNTSTEVLVNNLYKDIMKAKSQETSKGMKPKGKVTKRGLWKILDEC